MTQTKSTVQMTSHTEDYDAHLRQVIDTYTDALETCGAKALLLHAGGIKTAFLDDRTYPFIVNPHFNYWAPLHQNNDCLIFFRPGEKPTLFYLQPEDYWHQPPRDLQEAWCHHWQIQSIGHIREAHNQIGDPSGICYIGEDTGLANAWRIGHINPKAVLDQVHFARATKTDYELACMQEANRIAARGHKAAAKAFYDGLSEFEINTQYLATIAHRETETPYSSIIAVNAHAAVLHYQHYDTFRLSDEERHSFLIDAGACYKGYASDITRTYSARGGIFAELIDEMEKHQLSLISKIKTGILYEELNRAMHEQLAEILRAFDLIRLA
ncbi:MAG: Xaa-Pro dipeptidase, partial [Gammaproteobacteria bacterium]|nr:Xaa-Pro dipeptidase [Gammaproteobacteria bacterium]